MSAERVAVGDRVGRGAFLAGALGLVLCEVANVYFVMPLPGSQRMASIGVAHALFRGRWVLRVLFAALAVIGLWRLLRAGGRARWWAPPILLLSIGACVAIEHQMAADRIFLQPTTVSMVPAPDNRVALDRLVLGMVENGEARAYPIQFLGYHHQVRDTVGGTPVLVTYCTVCRTGRVFSPLVSGHLETFRLVGMDHFNAMFEDASTGSWWRQANGEAIAGPRKGQRLATLDSQQMTLGLWLKLHPASLVMQPDARFADQYPRDTAYERGTSRKKLTGTDPDSWADKSWVVGIELDGHSKAFDWNHLRTTRIVHDQIGSTPILLVLAEDDAGFTAYRRPTAESRYRLRDNVLVNASAPDDPPVTLPTIPATQEFWHSWRTFHPATERSP